MPSTALSPWEEHLFWLGILEDHAQFAIDHLGAEETARALQAHQFRTAFAALRRRLFDLDRRLSVDASEQTAFARDACVVASDYYRFEGGLQKLRIENAITLQLTPAYFNGTLLENEEYVRILCFYSQGRDYPRPTLYRLLDMWLEDQLGHAVLLADHLDPSELGIIERSRRFIQTFQAHMVKNRAIGGFLRFMPPNFPAQRKFAGDVADTTAAFNVFVKEMVALASEHRLLGRLTIRFLEHHLPETCYFLHQLSRYEPNVKPPSDCYLWKPQKP